MRIAIERDEDSFENEGSVRKRLAVSDDSDAMICEFEMSARNFYFGQMA